MPPPTYDVFLSHSSADKPAVESLAHKLRAQGIEPFLDKWHLVPGKPWQEALEEALLNSGSCAVFIGPGGISRWERPEMRVALDRGAREDSFRVIAVLLPGAEPDLPPFLTLYTWVDFRNGLDDENAFHRFVAGIRGQAPGPGEAVPFVPSYRSMAPSREAFVHRREYDRMVEALVAGAAGTRDGSAGLLLGVRGAGGFGKTALAQAVCWDDCVLAAYPDGVLWTTMGEDVDPAGRLARVRDLIRWWKREDPPAFETVSAAGAHLREALKGRRVLLVVDDVWKPEDVTPLQGVEAGAALLVTTRDVRTLPAERILIEIDAMASSEAVTLLGAELPAGQEAGLAALASRLGEWPLLLKIVNRQLRELVREDGLAVGQALREIGEALDAEGLTVFDQGDTEGRDQAVTRTLEVSLKRLSAEERTRYDELGIFPEDRDIPLAVLARLWGAGSFATKKLCDRLHDLSLLLRFDRPAGTIRLHDVVRAYLIRTNQKKLPAIHKRLLDAFRPPSGRWSDLPRDETYLWRHLANHLAGSGEETALRELLLDFSFLQAKLEATDVNALLADYAPAAEKDPELRTVHQALHLSVNVLGDDRYQLAGQILGRLLGREEPGIQRLLRGARDWRGSLWLRPKTPTLLPPGGPLLCTLEGHTGRVSGIAILDSRRIVSGSFDKTLRLWDGESGESLRAIEVQALVGAVARVDSRRVLSGSGDSVVRLWDLETGECLRHFPGHSGWINALAAWDGRGALSASDDKTLRVWDLESGDTLHVLQGHREKVTAAAVLNGRLALSGSEEGEIRLWNLETGAPAGELAGHTGAITALAVLDETRAVSSSFTDGTVRLWDLETRQPLRTLGDAFSTVTALTALDRRRVVVVSGLKSTLEIWDVETGETLRAIQIHTALPSAVAVLNEKRAVSASDDGTLRVWDLEAQEAKPSPGAHFMTVVAVAALDEARAVSAGYNGDLRIWDLESGRLLHSAPPQSGFKALAILQGGSLVLASEQKVLIREIESGRDVRILEAPPGGIDAFAARGPRAVSGTRSGSVYLWDLEGGGIPRRLGAHLDVVETVCLVDDRRVVSGSLDSTLRIWDLESAGGEPVHVLQGHEQLISVVKPLDEHHVLSGSSDCTLWLWNVESGEGRLILGHTGWVNDLAVLSERQVVSASKDWTVRLWDMESGRLLASFTLDTEATTVAVSPDRRTLVVGDNSGRIHILEIVEPDRLSG